LPVEEVLTNETKFSIQIQIRNKTKNRLFKKEKLGKKNIKNVVRH